MTCFTIFYTHVGSEIIKFGAECNIEQWMLCYHPRLTAGFPFAFYFDFPGVSVENQIGFLEDEFRLYPFLIDLWIYYLLLFTSYHSFRSKK